MPWWQMQMVIYQLGYYELYGGMGARVELGDGFVIRR